MSTMVSSVYPENLHKDFQNSYFENFDIAFPTNTGGLSIDASDQFPLMNNIASSAAWALQRPAGLTRRNSTSSVSSITSSRNRMSNNPLTSIANIIPETSTATLTAAASILSSMPTTTEEKFRGRAYSEGANSLSMESTLQAQQQPIASSRYKTELCRPFEENGKCKYGDKCQFAHGKQELRQLVRHPKYKTELCRTFHTSGFCPYGPRCHFIHNQEDLNKRGNVMSSGNVAQQTPQQNAFSMMPQRCAPVAVPTPHTSERNHFEHRPAQLNLFKQLAAGSVYGNMGYAPASPLGSSPPHYHGDIGQTVLMSPTSPNSVGNGSIFNFNNVVTQADNIPVTTAGLINMLSEMQQHSPTSSNFDMFRSQGIKNETTVNDDSAFDGTPTPPDSDHESLTGSPPEKQRLPIFRCLSQSD